MTDVQIDVQTDLTDCSRRRETLVTSRPASHAIREEVLESLSLDHVAGVALAGPSKLSLLSVAS